MANTPSSAFPLDIQHEARHRWLRPSQISQILRNYHNFHISPQPPHTPPSGSLFLFDRKVLRYFRKDGHNWRKKKDGKTVKEAHEKLKVGSVDVLHCYYAHGEENACFQRRSYWLLEEEFMHIVFVHYLEVKGSNRSTSRETHSVISNSQLSNSFSSSVPTSYNDAHAGNVGSPSAASTLTSTNEDIESEDNHQAMSKYPTPHSFYYPEYSFENNNMGALTIPKISSDFPDEYNLDHSGSGLNFISLAQRGSGNDGHNQFKTVDLASWEEVFEQCTTGSENLPSHLSIAGSFPINTNTSTDYNDSLSQLLDIGYGVNSGVEDFSTLYNSQRNNPSKLSTTEPQDNLNSSLSAKQPLIGTIKADEGLQKVDSFSKWMTKELDGVDDLDLKPSSNLSWQNIETTTAGDDPSSQLDNYSMSPSIGQDQLFDIHDFSPNCAYTDTETKVVITGKFLVSPPELSKYNWSCMFGQVEVPAEILGNDTLCCYAPLHSAGLVPFYVTCSNRFACSQVREFEYLEESPNTDHKPTCRSNLKDTQLFIRLEKLLSMKSSSLYDSFSYHFSKKPLVVDKILVLMEDEICWGVEQPLKQKLVSWLVDKVNEEDGKGPNVVDKEGQGLLHLAAALAFDWIIPPTLAAGVSVNFRDVNGWTALHWAACYGREKTVAFLIALGAAPGALTDPSPEFPLGRTPADLASANGYKGISGYLAESSLTAHLASLTMNDKNLDPSLEDSIVRAVQTVKDRVATSCDDGDGSDLSLRDSLAAVRNATQAAGRIHQVFRMQSFQRKQVRCCDGDDESLLGDQRVISLIASKIQKHRHFDEQSHSAAVHIQKKYRGYKKRKEFLIIRDRVVKIQAHVRGHQVRKRYKTVVWSVGILEKVILRWRRKGTGLRGFRPESQNKMSDTEDKRSEEDDYDFLKEGRKQTEERLEKALVRVKSMVQYPEGRAQYRRLVSAVEDLKKNQQHLCSKILDSRPENVGVEGEEDMLDVESLLDDDNLMALTFE